MGVIRKIFLPSILGASGAVAYLAAKNPVVSPLAPSDPLWTSKPYKRFNPNANPATQDVCVRRIPLDKVRPELLQKDGALALEFCRGVWSGWGYAYQRRFLEKKYRNPVTEHQLWDNAELAKSNYDVGTIVTDHFEVVEKTPTSITVRCGDTPRNPDARESDGLFVISATVDKERNEVELGLKSCFFPSKGVATGNKGPMPGYIEELHQWYSRILSETGARRLLK